MSYPRDLDEFTSKELTDEMARRLKLQLNAECDYCGRPGNTAACRFPERHGVARNEYARRLGARTAAVHHTFLSRMMRVL